MRNGRVNFIFLMFLLFISFVVYRLYNIQIKNGDYWQALAKGQQSIFKIESPERGRIFFQDKDRELYLVAMNKKEIICYAVPKEIKDKEEIAKELSQILKLKEDDILESLSQTDNMFVLLKEDLSGDEINQIKGLSEKGIYLGERPKRYYPRKDMASAVIGFVGGEDHGQYGIEGYYDNALSGREGRIFGERDVRGVLTFLDPKKSVLPKDGADVVLTIDYYIQSMAEKLLEEAKDNFNIESGQIIVMNPQTGEIKAMASYPLVNLNHYYDYDMKDFINPSIQGLFEPGSVFKGFTMASALDLEKITPETKYVDKGYVKIGGSTIYNYGHRVWGEKTMTEVLEKSINTGAVFAEEKIPHREFVNYLDKFGFFEKTGIDLQGESFSENKEFKKGYEINFATASFGQGVEITPIQLVRGYSAIANGGKIMKPFLVSKIKERNGKVIDKKPEIERENVISQKAANELKKMLVKVVEKGYGKKAGVPGYFIAGKTGTSQVPWASLGISKKGYSDKTWQTFIGFFPAFHPQFLILVKLDNPETKTSEYSAAPIFHDLAKYIIDYWQIPPDYTE